MLTSLLEICAFKGFSDSHSALMTIQLIDFKERRFFMIIIEKPLSKSITLAFYC